MSFAKFYSPFQLHLSRNLKTNNNDSQIPEGEPDSRSLIIVFVGNKAKGQISKMGVSRKQSMSNYPKNEHFLPPYTYTYLKTRIFDELQLK